MKKVGIFVEGQTEQIFIEKLIYQIFSNVYINSIEFYGGRLFIEGVDKNTKVDYFFLIIDVGNDEKVLSSVLDNASKMIQIGYCKVFGLRDLYPKFRDDEGEVETIINELISGSEYKENIECFLAVMETEAWFLADYNVFSRIDKKLTYQYIKDKLGVDLINEDPELQ